MIAFQRPCGLKMKRLTFSTQRRRARVTSASRETVIGDNRKILSPNLAL
jgi:hypothetical protein